MSVNPVFSSTYLILFHVLPPSVVLYTPRSGLGPKRCPGTATYTTSGCFGSMTMRAIVCDSFSPMFVNVFPPSVDLYKPSPNEDVCLLFGSPVPTYTISGFVGSTASAPIDAEP